MEQPKYSIIVPVYKTQAYIRQCLDSIRDQTYGNLEAILVDDGSPDRCGEICDEYAVQDARFRVIHKENGGSTSARKVGAEVCTGDYVICVDSDDYIADDLLERLTAIIAEYEPDVVSYGGCRVMTEGEYGWGDSVPVGIYRGDDLETIHDELVVNREHQISILFNLATRAIKRSRYIHFQMPVPDEINVGEDLAVIAPLLAQCASIYISDIQGYYYRDNPSSITNTFKRTEPQQILWVAEYLDEAMGEAYQRNIDAFVLNNYYNFLVGLMSNCSNYREFSRLQNELWKEDIEKRTKRVRCESKKLKVRLRVALMSHRSYWVIWAIWKIRRALGRREKDRDGKQQTE